jgi:FlaA1/EpsC-like NDP-sugar epimerase
MKLALNRAHVAFAHDVAMAAISVVLSLYLRLGNDAFQAWEADRMLLATLLFTMVAGGVFWSRNLYRGVWRYASLDDLIAITKAVTLTILIYLPVMFLVTRLEQLPRSILIINWFVLLALLGGPRFIYRIWKDQRLDLKLERQGWPRTPVLLVGAGDAAELFIRACRQSAQAPYRPVAILSESGGRVGRDIHGVPVLGTVAELESVVADLRDKNNERPQRLVITQDTLDGATVRQLLDRATALGMSLARLPRLTDLRGDVEERVEIKPVAIEDLLQRPQTVLDREAMRRLIAGRRILITGAGGSIGSELVRQIAALTPSRLTLLDQGEFNLYTIDMELAGSHPDLPRDSILADVRDRDRIHGILAATRPEIVFHAAALKHVPLVEYNPCEGVRTNVSGTRNVADACRAHGVRVMVQVSTDKAVNPTNVMGASKRVAESYCQSLDLEGARARATRFLTVRFGNVLGSTGSVVPLFQKQLAAGGPLTVTHPEMTRYFMTVKEAVELVLQASALGMDNAEFAGKIFVLDMGEPVRIVDLARQMIRLAGLRPEQDVQIAFSGLRPGEKLFEEIFHGAEPPVATGTDGVLVAQARPVDHALLSRALDELDRACQAQDQDDTRALLMELVPEAHLSPSIS